MVPLSKVYSILVKWQIPPFSSNYDIPSYCGLQQNVGVGVLVYILFSVGRGRAVGVRIVEISIIM